MHFAGGDLLIGCAVKTEFAHAEGRFFGASIHSRLGPYRNSGANGRTKDAASHRAMSVEVAGSDCGIERGARFVVREVLELALGALALAEKASCEVAGKIGRDFDDGCLGSLANSCGASGIGLGQVGEAFL